MRRQLANGMVSHFVFLADGRLLGEYDGSTGAVIQEYIWLGDRLVGQVDGAGTLRSVLTGHLGQPLRIMSTTADVLWDGEMDPFGQYHAQWGSEVEPIQRLPGQWYERGAGLVQNWHRSYDPTLGRYLQADPIGLAGGQSVYGYAYQNPMSYVDPDGLQQLIYDGSSLTYEDASGSQMRSWPAISGSPNSCQCKRDQHKQSFGPIPDGRYSVDPSDTNRRRFWKLDWGSESAWGNARTLIRPQPGTNTFGRRGMYIHGGMTPGSAGCIDLTSSNDNFHDWLSDYGQPIDLIVDNPN